MMPTRPYGFWISRREFIVARLIAAFYGVAGGLGLAVLLYQLGAAG